jgi:hypothetical protein
MSGLRTFGDPPLLQGSLKYKRHADMDSRCFDREQYLAQSAIKALRFSK